MSQIVRVLYEQSQSSWSDDFEWVSYYNWTGTAGALSPMVPNSGNGEPKQANGLVASSHRPSDDLCVFSELWSRQNLYVMSVIADDLIQTSLPLTTL